MRVDRVHADPSAAADRAASPLTMQAVVQDLYGPVDVLRLDVLPVPPVRAHDVLMRVAAASLHIGDWHVMSGRPYLMRVAGFGLRAPKLRVRGMDAAGTVVAVGSEVRGLGVGDEVYGTCDGALAEYATARTATLAAKPARLSFEQAAAVPTSACTALQALRAAGQIEPGQRVLVVGASGGVGLFAVQIAKTFGAEVTGVCSTAKTDLVRSVGADHTVDYSREDITHGAHEYDVILDLGGTRTLTQLRRVLPRRGTLVLVGGEGGGRWVGAAMVRSLRALALSPLVRQKLRMVLATTTTEDLRLLAQLFEDGQVTPVLDRAYPLGQAPDALRRLIGGEARGKLVVTVSRSAHG
jgi:NADPH:quinone reductase-like Zn-dependent oxidoreductase